MLWFILLIACRPDLPAGWEDAQPVLDLTQSPCDGDPYGENDERVEATAEGSNLAVDYLEAHFRCAQEVEGFYREDADTVDVLVQPIDMDPRAVAGCDCLYNVSMTVPVAAPVSLTLFRRWDNINDPNDPVEIGSVDVVE